MPGDSEDAPAPGGAETLDGLAPESVGRALSVALVVVVALTALGSIYWAFHAMFPEVPRPDLISDPSWRDRLAVLLDPKQPTNPLVLGSIPLLLLVALLHSPVAGAAGLSFLMRRAAAGVAIFWAACGAVVAVVTLGWLGVSDGNVALYDNGIQAASYRLDPSDVIVRTTAPASVCLVVGIVAALALWPAPSGPGPVGAPPAGDVSGASSPAPGEAAQGATADPPEQASAARPERAPAARPAPATGDPTIYHRPPT